MNKCKIMCSEVDAWLSLARGVAGFEEGRAAGFKRRLRECELWPRTLARLPRPAGGKRGGWSQSHVFSPIFIGRARTLSTSLTV